MVKHNHDDRTRYYDNCPACEEDRRLDDPPCAREEAPHNFEAVGTNPEFGTIYECTQCGDRTP